jgi:hypothetical protein
LGPSQPSSPFRARRAALSRSATAPSSSALVGYRFLYLDDKLSISHTSVALGGGGPIVAGTTFTTTDSFATANSFHGLDLGLTGDMTYGPWTLTWLTKVALGATLTDVDIAGGSTITVPGVAPAAFVGGLYALPSNSGSFDHSRFAVASEVGAKVSYRITERLRAQAGYSLLYWTGLVRAGSTVDTTINTTQLPPGPLVGAARPLPQAYTSDYWAQGLNVGLAYSF